MTKTQYSELWDFLVDRFNHIDQKFDQVDQRFVRIESRLGNLENSTDYMMGELKDIREELVVGSHRSRRMEGWIIDEVNRGAVLPGLYPMNAENKERYEASRKKG